MNIVKFNIGDLLIMKKTHPCGCNIMEVMKIGSDIKLRCSNCKHEFIVPRIKIEKNIKRVENNIQTN